MGVVMSPPLAAPLAAMTLVTKRLVDAVAAARAVDAAAAAAGASAFLLSEGESGAWMSSRLMYPVFSIMRLSASLWQRMHQHKTKQEQMNQGHTGTHRTVVVGETQHQAI